MAADRTVPSSRPGGNAEGAELTAVVGATQPIGETSLAIAAADREELLQRTARTTFASEQAAV